MITYDMEIHEDSPCPHNYIPQMGYWKTGKVRPTDPTVAWQRSECHLTINPGRLRTCKQPEPYFCTIIFLFPSKIKLSAKYVGGQLQWNYFQKVKKGPELSGHGSVVYIQYQPPRYPARTRTYITFTQTLLRPVQVCSLHVSPTYMQNGGSRCVGNIHDCCAGNTLQGM